MKTLVLPEYYKDPYSLHIGCAENRSYYIPYGKNDSVEEDLLMEPSSSRYECLNGQWDFRYYKNPFIVEDFTEPEYSYENYHKIPVPGCIQMYGYDCHQYTNVNYPFPYDPPYVPEENPTCVYHCCFNGDVQDDFCTFLDFEGVDSCFYVYINNKLVGYSQVSHSTSEFNITDYIKSGINHLTVVVLKWCDGSYLEDQDKFRMTGIFRDVYILKRPKEAIKDFFVHTNLNVDYNEADIQVDLTYFGQQLDVKYTFFNEKGEEIASGIDGEKISFKVKEPILWNPENPYLYTLKLETDDEVIYQKVGIRQIQIINNIIMFNGKRIKIKGVNRHDSDPVTGYTISRQQAYRDLVMMKSSNINGIRTSHYPNAPWFVQLCNEIGFYVIGEADVESHGARSIYNDGSHDSNFGDIVQRKIYFDGVMDRNQRNVIRDKNNPCIFMWSMGNEAGYGKSFEETGKWIKEYDPSRLVHYESSIWESGGHKNDTSMLDVYSTMYASVDDINKYIEKNPKPYVLCEFIHAMGNGPGDIEDYFECIYKQDRVVGGFVWEWCDHGIFKGVTKEGKKIFYYGGDSGEFPHDGNFCVDGMVSPDRIPHPALVEYKNVIRPARATLIDGKKGLVQIENKLDFTNLAELLEIKYELQCDGETVYGDVIEIPSVEPHKSVMVQLDYSQKLEELPREKNHTLKITYLQIRDDLITKKGHMLGFDQLWLNDEAVSYPVPMENCNNNVEFIRERTEIIIKSSLFEYTYDLFSGNFKSIVFNNRSILKKPMDFNIWRAPVDNDRNIRHKWQQAGYDRKTVRVYNTEVKKAGKNVVIESKFSISAIYLQRILDLSAVWTIYPNGAISVDVLGTRSTDMPFLPRLGLRLTLNKDYENVNYLGYGPMESYIDKHRASWFGEFNDRVEDMYVDYIMPQENSSHFGCHRVQVTDSKGKNITVRGKKPFSFNASHYSQEELDRKAHNYELCQEDATILSIDYKMSGVGSNACGPQLDEKYQLCEKEIDFSFTLVFS